MRTRWLLLAVLLSTASTAPAAAQRKTPPPSKAAPTPAHTAAAGAEERRLEELQGHKAAALLRSRQADQLEAPNPFTGSSGRAPAFTMRQRIYEPTPLPQFALHLLDAGAPLPSPFGRRGPGAATGRIVSSDTLRGRVAVLDFWGVWCAPCVAELPDIQRAWERVRGNRAVVFLTIDMGDAPDSLGAFMTRHHYDFPVLLDDGFAQRAGVVAYPSTLVLDRAGKKLVPTPGARVHDEIVRLVEQALGGAASHEP